jgi:hypothetical protein
MLNKNDLRTAAVICKELAAYIEETEPWALNISCRAHMLISRLTVCTV